jgi:hypothetical protein
MDDISKHIKKIYVQTDYFSKYGPDVLVSLLIILFFSVFIVYFFLKSNLGEVKERLKKNKCDSRYIFFSGWVSKKENQTPLGATMENMTICLNDIIYSAFIVFVEPVFSMTKNIFTQNFMQVGLTGTTATQVSALNMINLNLHVGMKLFQDHLKLVFVPIIKLNHIINDSLEKFVLILQILIYSLEIHRLNIKHILLSMYKSLLKITIKNGEFGNKRIKKGYKQVKKGQRIFDKYDIPLDINKDWWTNPNTNRKKEFLIKKKGYELMLKGWGKIQKGYARTLKALEENKKENNQMKRLLKEIYTNEGEKEQIQAISPLSDKLMGKISGADDIFMNDKGEDGYGRKQLFKGIKTYREKGPDFSKKDRGFTVEKPKNTGS